MKYNHLKISLICATILGAGSVSAFAAECAVPTAGYPNIQAAVDDPTCSVINVAPGAYSENVSIPRSVTLNGARAGQPTGTRISGGPAESTVNGADASGSQPVFRINAPSVTIDGFTIKNSTTGSATGVEIAAASNDAVVFNSFIDGIEAAAGNARGVCVRNGSININVGANEFRNISASGVATGVLVGENNATIGSDIVFIHDNTFSGIASSGASASAAICLKAFANSTAFFFRGNHISNLTGATATHAVSIEGDLINPLVIENDFAALTSPSADVAAIWFNNDPSAYSADAGGNLFFLTPADYGVKIEGGASTAVYPPPMSAGCNWWGSPDGPGPVGPGHGALVSAGIRYSPWRVTPTTDAGSCIGNNVPTSEAQCKAGGWITHVRADGSTFKSQGDCVQYLNNGK
jgi:hypothetical protein